MAFQNVRIGFGLSDLDKISPEIINILQQLVSSGISVTLIIPEDSSRSSRKFYPDSVKKLIQLTGQKPIHTIQEAKQVVSQQRFDCLIVGPCSGVSLEKLAMGTADDPVFAAAKAHLRRKKPVIVTVWTDEGLNRNAWSIGILLKKRYVYLVPFEEERYGQEGRALTAHLEKLPAAVSMAFSGKQLYPILDDLC